MTKVTFLDVIDRAHTGPVCRMSKWDTKVIFGGVKEKLKEYGLEGTCDPANPVNTDGKLADDFWKAGFDFAVEVGMLCMNTERVIKFSEDELKTALKEARDTQVVGLDLERIVVRNRKPEDTSPTVTVFGPFGTPTTEELFVKAVQAAAQYRSCDAQIQPTLQTVYDREHAAGTPYEVLMGKLEALLSKEGARRAGRPGIAFDAVAGDATGLGHYGGYGIRGTFSPKGDWGVVLTPSDLKTNYYLLNKVAHVFNADGYILVHHYSMIGGYAGSPEGCIVSTNAAAVLQLLVHQATLDGASVFDSRTLSGSGRDCNWANSVAIQGQSRNTHILNCGVINPLGGPCTEMLLYEAAAQGIVQAVSGAAYMLGIRPRAGRYPNYFSGLESCFSGEVCKAAAGMKCSEANEMVKILIPKYEAKLSQPDVGKSFTECTDLKTLRPTQEWLDIYNKIKKELADLGLQL